MNNTQKEQVRQQMKALILALGYTPMLQQVGDVMENNLVVKHSRHGVECAITVTPTRFIFRSPRPNRYNGSFASPATGLRDFSEFVEHHHRG